MCSNESDARDCAKLRLSSEISVGDSVEWIDGMQKKRRDDFYLQVWEDSLRDTVSFYKNLKTALWIL